MAGNARIRKNSKFIYWLKNIIIYLEPNWLYTHRKVKIFNWIYSLDEKEFQEITDRVDYYCCLPKHDKLEAKAPTLGGHKFFSGKKQAHHSTYFFDSYCITRYFGNNLHWYIQDGDVNVEMQRPTIAKTRPVKGKGCSNNVLLNMDKVRHFLFIKDPVEWEQKQGKVLFRGVIYSKENRRRFVEMYGDNPICDLKDTDRNSPLPEHLKAKTPMSLREHLDYRYIMSLEGNDVASNLKWVMSSNSIAVMPKPTCESWYMEGKLVGDYHYIEIKSDFSDLLVKIQYYETHPDEAKRIIAHAHQWVAQFQDKKKEEAISILTMQKYLRETN